MSATVQSSKSNGWHSWHIISITIILSINANIVLPTSASSASYHQLWYDDMSVGKDWNVTGKAADELNNCHIGSCVKINEGAVIKRQFLSTQNYDNIQLTYSIKVSNLEHTEFCALYYSTNGAKWVLLKKYTKNHNEELFENQMIDLPYNTYNNPNVQIQFMFGANHDHNFLNGSCFIDELYIHGTPVMNIAQTLLTRETRAEVIWYDDMSSGNGWYFENTSDHTQNCYIGDCVQMSGNSYIERDGLSTKNYKNIQLRYSIKPVLLKYGESCNVYYSVDNENPLYSTDWKLIGEYNELFNDQYQINEILDLPLDADNHGNIQIKFNLTQKYEGDEINKNRNHCYVDEVYLMGIKQIVMNHGYTATSHILVAVLTYQLFF